MDCISDIVILTDSASRIIRATTPLPLLDMDYADLIAGLENACSGAASPTHGLFGPGQSATTRAVVNHRNIHITHGNPG
jgi:hypothetical protein